MTYALPDAAVQGEGEVAFHNGIEGLHPNAFESNNPGSQIHHMGDNPIFDKSLTGLIERKDIAGENFVQLGNAFRQR